MSDSTLNRFMAYGTNAQRLAFTPSVPTPASGPSQVYFWYETDTTDTYAYASAAWHKVNTTGGLANAATFQNSGGNASGTTFDGSVARTIGPDTFGLGTANSPQFTAVNIGHASDTTVTRTGAGDLAIEGNAIYRAGGTDVPVTDGGTGASSASSARTNLGLAIGTDVQAWDAQLDTVAALTGSLIKPGGRLTLVSGTPIMTSDQTAKGTIYYTPDQTDLITLYDGTIWTLKTFAELTLTLDSTNHPIENLFDVFICNDSGTIKVGTGPAWNYNATVTMTIATPCVVTWTAHGLPEGTPIVFTTSGALPTGITAGTTYYVGRSPATDTFNVSTTVANAAAGTFVATSGSQSGTHTGTNHTRARGTGAGTTELERKNGIWTNKNSIALKNGAGAAFATISANQATYVGTFYTTAAGQTGMAFTPAAAGGGTNNILGLFNAYNRIRTLALNRDNTASWIYATATVRMMNNNAANRIAYVDGLAQVFVGGHHAISVAGATDGFTGMLRNSTDQVPQTSAVVNSTNGVGGTNVDAWPPSLGFNYVQATERSSGTNKTYFGLLSSQQANELVIELEM